MHLTENCLTSLTYEISHYGERALVKFWKDSKTPISHFQNPLFKASRDYQ